MRLPRGFRKVIRKNRDGSERAFIQARAYKHDDLQRRKRISLYGRTCEDVKRKLRDLQGRKVASFDAGKERLRDYLGRFLGGLKADPETAPRTYELYFGIVHKHIAPYIGSIALGKLRPSEIDRLFKHRLSNVGSRMRQLVYRVLHYALDAAVADERISMNPCLVRFKPKHKYREFRSLTREEAHRLLEAAKKGGHYMLFYLALATGSRQGELFGLRWENVDLEHGFLSVCGTLTTDDGGKLVVRPPKGKRSRRIDLSPATQKLLREHKRKQYPLSPWVFSDTKGNPIRKDNFMYRIFRPLTREANLAHIRFHDLRHTSATLALAAGENIKVVQERLGHASAKMTLDVYAKAVPTLQRESAIRMDAILSPYGATFGATRRRVATQKALKAL